MSVIERAKEIQKESIEKLKEIKQFKESIRLQISIVKTRVHKKGLEEEATSLNEIEEKLL